MKPKSPTHVCRDALVEAERKLLGGCVGCAESYVRLAHEHGATDDEMRPILRKIQQAKQYRTPGISRAAFIQRAALGVGGVALLGVYARHPNAGGVLRADATRVSAAGAAWILGTSANGSGSAEVFGVQPSGSVVASLPSDGKEVFLSSDGTALCLLGQTENGATTAVDLAAYDSSTGALMHSMKGAAIDLGYQTGFDLTQPFLIPKSSYLAVLHQVRFIITPHVRSVTRPGRLVQAPNGSWVPGPDEVLSIDDATTVTGVEILDLARGASVAYQQVREDAADLLGGRIVAAPTGGRLHVFTMDKAFDQTLTALDFDGSTLSGASVIGTPQPGSVVGGFDSGASDYLSADGATLIRFAPPYAVFWIDPATFTASSTIELAGGAGAKGYAVVPLPSAGGDYLYIADTFQRTITAVSTAGRSIAGSVSLPKPSSSGLLQGRLRFGYQSAGIDTSAGLLYMVDSLQPNALWKIDATALAVAGSWQLGSYIDAVSVDAQTGQVFVADALDGSIRIVDPNGTVTATVTLPGSPGSFVS